ncbi:MAG: hypothetical protein J6S67_22745 [Methanobrevibacter sp.]|nr:hypothetical protein [Methanobrevibacter sp.]
MMEISEIYAAVIAAAPAITAVIGILVSLIVGIKKVKNTTDSTLSEVKRSNAEIAHNVEKLVQRNIELEEENKELKRELRTTLAYLKKVKDKED